MTTQTFNSAIVGNQPSRNVLSDLFAVLGVFARCFNAKSAPVAGSWADGARGL